MKSNQRNSILGRGAWAVLAVLGGGLGIWAATGWQSLDARAAVAPGSGPRPGALLRLSDDLDTADAPAPLPAALSSSPEAALLGAYRLVGEGRLADALSLSHQLVQQHPEFRLGQLLYADLLAAHQQALPGFGAAQAAQGTTPPADALSGLRDEALARLAALAHRPAPGALPAEFVSLPATVEFALAVDTSHSRLYVFQHTAAGLTMVSDFYVSVGKRGVGKETEGDQRTPLGVYYTQGHVSGARLDERFGAGALPLNYPNALDRQRGRTGSGILLHGVPANTYSRPPLDSDGCVAMSNQDLQRLSQLLPERDTPVVITRQIHWVSPEQKPAAPADFARTWATWQEARQQARREALEPLYADSTLASASSDAARADDPSGNRFRRRLEDTPAQVEDVSILAAQDEQATLVVTFRERATTGKRRNQGVRQYWARQEAGWRIVAEGPVR